MIDPVVETARDGAWPSPFVFGDSWRECSHRGDRRNGSCVCHPGWTGISDLVSARDAQCHIHVYTVDAMHLFLAALILHTYVFRLAPGAGYLRARYARTVKRRLEKRRLAEQGGQFSSKDKNRDKRGARVGEEGTHDTDTEEVGREGGLLTRVRRTAWEPIRRTTRETPWMAFLDDEVLLVVGWVVIVMFPAMLAMGALRVAGDLTGAYRRVGYDWDITVAWLLARLGINAVNIIYQPAVLQAVLKAERFATHVVARERRMYLRLGVASFLTGLVCSVVVISTRNPSDALNVDVESISIARASVACFAICNTMIFAFFYRESRWMENTIKKYFSTSALAAAAAAANATATTSGAGITSSSDSSSQQKASQRNVQYDSALSNRNEVSSITSSWARWWPISRPTALPATPGLTPVLTPAAAETMHVIARTQVSFRRLTLFLSTIFLCVFVLPFLWIANDYVIPLTFLGPILVARRFYADALKSDNTVADVSSLGNNSNDRGKRAKSPARRVARDDKEWSETHVARHVEQDSAASGLARQLTQFEGTGPGRDVTTTDSGVNPGSAMELMGSTFRRGSFSAQSGEAITVYAVEVSDLDDSKLLDSFSRSR